MTKEREKSDLMRRPEEECDIRIWSAECKRDKFATEGDKYMCVSFGKIAGLNHEVHHEVFPHISGDDDNLS